MGKTPGKWIKTLLGKKSSKSSLLKKKEIPKPADNADKGGALVSSNEPLPALPVEHPLVSASFPNFGVRNEVESQKEIAATLPNPEVSLLSAREDGNAPTARNLASLDDSQKIRHEQAAIQAQAAFRGYLARRAFRTLKGIIKLQALIRGHLVRRQAVATLSCVWGIIKLQALARGQKARRSDIGIEAQKIYSQGELLEAKCDNSCGLSLSTRAKRLRNNAYIQKLLATTPTSTPLHFQYGPGEANSVEEWLQRWTISRFWEPLPQPTNNQDPKPQSKHSGLKTKATDQTRPKRSVRKPSNANVENGSSRSASESEKRKRSTIRTVPSHTTDPVQEHPPIEKEKVKRNLRKTSDSTKDVPERSKVNEKTKQSLRKASDSPPSDLTELEATDSAENMKDVVTPEQSDLDTSPILPAADGLVDEIHYQPDETHDQSAVDREPVENYVETESNKGTDKEPNSNDINKENLKNNQRRASLPAKIDHQENGLHSTPKLPSYMAPTESAKARLRGQGSPRFTQEGVEKNGITRRLSLPSSTNGKLSSLSPRAQRLIQGSAKGVTKSDKSLLSSRDAGSKNAST